MTFPTLDVDAYARDGFCVLRGLFSDVEIEPLAAFLRDDTCSQGTFTVPDNSGGQAELMVWTQCGDDVIGAIPRMRRMVTIAEAAVGEPVYHWHSKITFKRPGRPGSWEWHQDYGHWYMEGCLWPAMTSIGIAIDTMKSDNGPLKLLRGSHHLGRIDHIPLGPSNGADPDRVARAQRQLDTVEIQLEPGDAVVFHCNVLHASGPNQSSTPRSLFMSSYNAVSNPPDLPKVAGHEYTPLVQLGDDVLNSAMTIAGKTVFRTPHGESVYGYQLEPN